MNERMITAIVVLTGFDPVEDQSSGEFELRLGVVDPIIIKYSKMQRKFIDAEELRSWALVSIIRAVCNMIEGGKFDKWQAKQPSL